jgi:hypothetical protein
MSVNRSIVIACAIVGLVFAALAFVAEGQTAPSQRPVLVAAATTTGSTAAPATSPAAAPSTAPAAGGQQVITRETYTYLGSGRRDPFVSLMNTEELRPLFQDLKLVAIAYDASGRNSVAVLRDVTSKVQYRVKVGQEIGRMRVASISEKSVLFGIEEFGYSRQETLAMNDSTKVRTQ